MAKGRLIQVQPITKSTFDRNFTAAANSIKPKSTFTMFIHEPLFGKVFSKFGKRAKSTKGLAKAAEKPIIPMIGKNHSPPVVAANTAPTKGAVHEKDTALMVIAMNKIPTIPEFSLLFLFKKLVS